ncbi:MAG: 7-carboxy-7-deazaguanine synthase QueE [Bacteroidetes bacterium]|nr:MAG: 7-carboxy-7-deazaguanine synthase QueE [Bacteroidota bacterium]
MNQSYLLECGKLLPVMEEFYSLQGEGFNTGMPSWFIRIGGCDVGCDWCDVKESWNADLFPPVDTDLVVARALQCPANAVIVTGGEPLLYNLDYLCEQIKAQGHKGTGARGPAICAQNRLSQIADSESIVNRKSKIVNTFLETSGFRPLSGIWDWICFSPKRHGAPRNEFYEISHELKVIIHEEEDFEWAGEQAYKMHAGTRLFLQPEWSRRQKMLPCIIRYIEDHPAWRLSLQMHKYIGIP